MEKYTVRDIKNFSHLIDSVLKQYSVDPADIPPALLALALRDHDVELIEEFCKGRIVFDPDDPTNKHGWRRFTGLETRPKRESHPYRDLSYIASMEDARLSLLSSKIAATKEYLKASAEYFEALDQIEEENGNFGFDLDL